MEPHGETPSHSLTCSRFPHLVGIVSTSHDVRCRQSSFQALTLRSVTDVVCQESVRTVTASRGARRAPGSSPQGGQSEGEVTRPTRRTTPPRTSSRTSGARKGTRSETLTFIFHLSRCRDSPFSTTAATSRAGSSSRPCLSFLDNSSSNNTAQLLCSRFVVTIHRNPSGPKVRAASVGKVFARLTCYLICLVSSNRWLLTTRKFRR